MYQNKKMRSLNVGYNISTYNREGATSDFFRTQESKTLYSHNCFNNETDAFTKLNNVNVMETLRTVQNNNTPLLRLICHIS